MSRISAVLGTALCRHKGLVETEREIDRPQSDKCEQCFRSSRFVAGAVSAAGIYKQSIFQVRFVFVANLFWGKKKFLEGIWGIRGGGDCIPETGVEFGVFAVEN